MRTNFSTTGGFFVGRQIVNTGGQGLASSDALKAAIGMIVIAAVVLLIFFFLNSAMKNHAAAFVAPLSHVVAIVTPLSV